MPKLIRINNWSRLVLAFLAAFIFIRSHGQQGFVKESDHQLYSRASAALLRAKLSSERSKIGLLRIFSEYTFLFGSADSLRDYISGMMTPVDSLTNVKQYDNDYIKINKKIWNYWKLISLIGDECSRLIRYLNIHKPAPVGVPSFALNTFKELSTPPDVTEDILVQVRFAELGAFYAEQCFQIIEVITEQFIAASYLKKRQSKKLTWINLGPFGITNGEGYDGTEIEVSGRVTSIALHPANPNIIFIGSALGGIWRSDDSGQNWKALTDFELHLAIGDLVIHPKNHDIILAGTGEANIAFKNLARFNDKRMPGSRGKGVLKSVDGGKTWSLKGEGVFNETSFSKIASSTANPDIFLAATGKGVFLSKDVGETWAFQKVTEGDASEIATSVLFKPGEDESAYACIWGKGVFRTDNLSKSRPKWRQLTGGLPLSNLSRIDIDISKNSPNYLVALISNADFYLRGVYESNDQGNSWTKINGAPDLLQGQGFYNMVIKYSPSSKDTLYIAGVGDRKNHLSSLFKGVRSDGKWYFLPIGQTLHVDFHDLEFDPKFKNIIYAANDGGLYRSLDFGANWNSCNRGLAITQINNMSQSASRLGFIVAGTQDNGTIIHTEQTGWRQVDKGDGGYVYVDQSNDNVVYNEYKQYFIARSDSQGRKNTFRPVFPKVIAGATQQLYAPFSVSPEVSDYVIIGVDGLYLTENGGKSWFRFNYNFANGHPDFNISTAFFANNDLIYVGTSNGDVFRVDRTSSGWNIILIFSLKKNYNSVARTIALAVDPSNPDLVYFTLEDVKVGRMWRVHTSSTDGPLSSSVIVNSEAADLRDGNIYAINFNENAETIIIGGEFGIYQSDNNGRSWTSLQHNLPRTTITDIEVFSKPLIIRVATYGRGVWQADLVK